MVNSANTERAVLAGGCFWGVQGVFERLKGVEETTAGFSGGSASTAHYEIVSTGTTGHAESVKVVFDPKVVSFGTLLKVFFSVVMNPTELDYQGPDHGTQYRSVIFYADEAQHEVARRYIEQLAAARIFDAPIATELVPLARFFPAEDYHQDYAAKHPDQPYIRAVAAPKVEKLRKYFADLLKTVAR